MRLTHFKQVPNVDSSNAALPTTNHPFLESSHDDEQFREPSGTSSPQGSPPRSFSPWSDGSASESETEANVPFSTDPLLDCMRNVTKLLEQLSRIGFAVRQSGNRSRLQKADLRFNPEEHKELERYLTTILLARPGFSKEKIEPIHLNEVQQRLIFCNLKRRNRFLCAQKHSQWLDPSSLGRMPHGRANDNIESRLHFKEDSTDTKDMSSLTQRLGRVANASTDLTTKTGTSASAISNSLALPQESTPPIAASTIMTSTITKIKYPNPPKIKGSSLVFTCPCCCQTLPIIYSKKNRWK